MTTSTTPGPRTGRHTLGAATPSPPGWYLDPSVGLTRWWDGRAWTQHIALPPLEAAASQAVPTSHRHGPVTVLPDGRGRHRADRDRGRTVSAGWVAMGIVAALAAVGVVSALRSDPGVSERPPSAPSSELLVTEAGTGDRVLPRFSASGPWQLQYSVDCGNLGHPGTFQVMTRSPATPRVLVDEHVASVSKVIALNAGPGEHTLQVRSGCGWVVTISLRPAVQAS